MLLSPWSCPTGCSHWWFGWSTRWKMILWHRHLGHPLSHSRSPTKPSQPAHRIHRPDKPRGHLHLPVKDKSDSTSLSARTLHCVGLFAKNGAGALHKNCTNRFPFRQDTKSSTKKLNAGIASEWYITELDRYINMRERAGLCGSSTCGSSTCGDDRNGIYRGFEDTNI